MEEEERLEQELRDEFDRGYRRGAVMNREEYVRLAKKKGLVGGNEARYARLVKASKPGLQRFWEPKGKRVFQTVLRGVEYGTLFVDLFFLGEPRANGGAVGFLLAAEAHTGLLAARPFKKKTLPEMTRCMRELLDETALSSVKTVLCDKESALLSRAFRATMKAERGIKMRYLTTRVKSFLAERYGRFVKTKLHALMADNKTRRWVDFLPALLRAHNSRKVPGTGLKRTAVSDGNLRELMEQKLDIKDFDNLMSVSTVRGEDIVNDDWLSKLFALEVGDTVRIAISAAPGGGKFHKPSSKGYFTEDLYLIVERRLATTKRVTVVPGKWK